MDNARIKFLRDSINAREFDGFVVAGLLQALRELAALNRYHAVETDTTLDADDGPEDSHE